MNKSFILLIVLVYFIFPASVFAEESSPKPSPIEYTLPYPGLLPDHPLYFLRAVRDTMQTFLVSSPAEKADFYLLQADKSLSASILLAEKKGGAELASATAFEAEQYFQKAVDSAQDAKKQGMDYQDISKKLFLANRKHQETITQLKNGADKHEQDLYKKAEDEAQLLEKKAKALLPAK